MSYNHGPLQGQPPYGYGNGNAQQDHRAYGAPQGGPGSFPNGQQFPGMANIPDFNISAPVIHMSAPGRPAALGGDRRAGRTDSYDVGGRSRPGLGADPAAAARDLERNRQQARENMMAAQPPTREEIARTIFIGGLGDGAPPDHILEHILKSVGKLRRWTRARDANNNKCRFGFAEFEDVDSLEAAKAAFDGGFDVPIYKDDRIVRDDDEAANVKQLRVLVVIDEQSSNYIDDWMSKRNQSEEARQFRVDTAKDDLRQCITALINDDSSGANLHATGLASTEPSNAERVEVEVKVEDDLADTDISPEVRATVAQEIQSFRDRAKRLDQERLKNEEAVKAADLARSGANAFANRLASPSADATANGIPSGPRVSGAPSGPKGYRGAQLPSDYVAGVAFVSDGANASLEEEDSEASDSELEERKKAQKEREQDKQFADAERRWLNREKQRLAANERERAREEAEEQDLQRKKEAMARRLESWDDEEEDRLGREDFYVDRTRWAQKRAKRRDGEARDDDHDRQAEQEEEDASRRHASEVRSAADQFLAQTGAEYAAAKQSEPANGAFKLSFGGISLKRTNKSGVDSKRTLAEVAGFLDDEEDAAAAGHQRGNRAMAQAAFDESAGADLSESERATKRQALATEIPSDTSSLFAWNVRWNYIEDTLLEREIRPFVNKKVLEYLGVQEDFLVDLVISGLKEHKKPQGLVADLQPALEDEAEVLVKKVWRLVVFWAEAESRGLN